MFSYTSLEPHDFQLVGIGGKKLDWRAGEMVPLYLE